MINKITVSCIILDVSGGYHPSILDAIRCAVTVSNTLAIQSDTGYNAISVKDAFKLATLGGAKGYFVY